MVTLATDQIMYIEQQYAVQTGGDYNETDLVPVYNINDPNKSANWAYPAYYIATGTMYESNDPPPAIQDWDGFINGMRGTTVFQKCFMSANTNAWALMLSCITTTHSIQDLQFAFEAVKASIPDPYGLTTDDVSAINSLLQQCNIPLQIS